MSLLIMLNGGTHRGRIIQALGGVGRNLCEALQRLGPIPPVFLSVVGQDPLAQFLNARFPHKENLRLRYVEECATATYTCILDQSGECLFGVGDMDIHNHITPQYVSAFKETIKMAPILIMDGNVPIETMDYVLQVCQEARVPVWFEPTDIHKASRPFQTNNWKALSYVSPNVQELVQMNAAVTGKNEDITISSEDLEDLLLQVTDLALPLLETIYVVLVTLGSHGILVLRRHKSDAPFPLKTNPVQVMEDISAIHYPTNPIENLVSVSGSGDCLAAAFISGALRGLPFNQCAMAAIRAASMSLKSPYTVPDELTFDAVFNNATGSQKTSQSQL